MLRKQYGLILAVASILLVGEGMIVITQTVFGEARSRQMWEYKIARLSENPLDDLNEELNSIVQSPGNSSLSDKEKALNAFGRQGWELVTVRHDEKSGDEVFVFKRGK